DLAEVARGFALDTVLFEQRGCASPRMLGVDADVDVQAFCAGLRKELGELAARIPVLLPPEVERADAKWFSALAEFCAEHQRVDLDEPARGSVSLQRAPRVPLVPPVGRNLVVISSDDCVASLAP